MKDPGNRFWATIAAQTAGVLLLFLIGLIFDITERCQQDIESGVHWIFVIAFLVFIGLVVGCVQAFVPTQKCNLNHDHVDTTLNTFLYVDIPLLTLLVCMEGGITRSMFVPLFFLIPIAQRAVEQSTSLRRVLRGVVAIATGMLLSTIVSVFVARNMRHLFGLSFLRVTDFSTLAPRRYAAAILTVSLISLGIWILQMQ
jgi:hypothetical protein